MPLTFTSKKPVPAPVPAAQSIAPASEPAAGLPWDDKPPAPPAATPAVPPTQPAQSIAQSPTPTPAAGGLPWQAADGPATTVKPVAAAVKSNGGGLGWMKKGQSSAHLAEVDKQLQEQRKSEMGKAYRFWLNDGEEAMITFVDGDFEQTPQGAFLLPPRYFEHNIQMNGRFGNTFVCPHYTNPDAGESCPICESGDRPSLVALFTIIDHRTFESKSKPGQKYTNTRKLLVATSNSFEQLQGLAKEVGGLAGSTWKVSRSGDKSPRIGNNWFPKGKTPIEQLKASLMEEVVDPKTNKKTHQTKFAVLDYEQEIIYRTGDELRSMGLGKPSGQVASGFGGQQKVQSGQSYAGQL